MAGSGGIEKRGGEDRVGACLSLLTYESDSSP